MTEQISEYDSADEKPVYRTHPIVMVCVGALVVALGISLYVQEKARQAPPANPAPANPAALEQSDQIEDFTLVEDGDAESASYDMVTRVTTNLFIFWLQDSKSCRMQIVLPPAQDGKRRRIILPSVDKSLCRK